MGWFLAGRCDAQKYWQIVGQLRSRISEAVVTLVPLPFDYLLLPVAVSKTRIFVHNSSIVWYKLLDHC